jgi:fumarate reductase (CoM/CoB) subunit A
MEEPMQTIKTDILIMGSGLAGIRAALAARESGLNVLVVGKNTPGRGTATILSGGGFSGGWGGITTRDHLELTLTAGRGLNDIALTQILADEAPKRFREMQQWGLPTRDRKGGINAAGKAPVYGRPLIDCLLDRARKRNVTFKDNIVLRAISACKDGAVALAWSRRDKGWMGLSARALIIAGGGACALYRRHDNPQRMTGDSCAIGYAAGVRLQDMEFVQFYPLCLAQKDLPSAQAGLIPPGLADHGTLTNDKGEDILKKYGIDERPAAIRARDRLSQALFRELEFEDQKVWLDVTKVTKEQWHSDRLSAVTWEHLGTRCGILQRPVRVAPVAHFFIGGISITPNCATNIEGIFAAGEACGGIHGANRMGGNALTEGVVFGARAGLTAAAWAQGNPPAGDSRLFDKLNTLVPPQEPGPPRDAAKGLKAELRKIMWRYGGILRNRKNLEKGLELLAEVTKEAAKTEGVTDPDEFIRLQELQMACITSGLIMRAALRREESRGAHFRTDFPETEDLNWRGHTKVILENDRRRWWFEKIR